MINNILNEETKDDEYYKKCYEIFLSKHDNLINIIQKYINEFEHKPDYKQTAEYLTDRVNGFIRGKKNWEKDGVEGFRKVLFSGKKGERPGLGFRRGLSEYMYPGPGEEYDWIREILDVARDLDQFWQSI